MRHLIWVGSAMALALALVLSNIVGQAHVVRRGELTDAARRMTEGDLSVRTHLAGTRSSRRARTRRSIVSREASPRRWASSAPNATFRRRSSRRCRKGSSSSIATGGIVLVNPALRAMLLLGTDAVGKLLIETVRHAQLDDLVEDARAAVDSKPVELELPGLKPRRLLVHASPLSGDDEGLSSSSST